MHRGDFDKKGRATAKGNNLGNKFIISHTQPILTVLIWVVLGKKCTDSIRYISVTPNFCWWRKISIYSCSSSQHNERTYEYAECFG